MASDFIANIKAQFDPSSLSAELKRLESQKVALNNVEITNAQFSQASLNSLKSQLESVFNGVKINLNPNSSGATGSTNAIKKSYQELLTLANQIGQKKIKLSGLDADKNIEQINVLKRQITELETEYNNLHKTSSGSLSTDQIEKLNKSFTNTARGIEEVEAKTKDATAALDVLTRSDTLSNNMETWMNNNTKAAEKYGEEIKNLQKQLSNNSSPTVLKKAADEFARIKSEAKSTGVAVSKFANSFKNTAKLLTGMTSTLMVVQTAKRVFKDMYDQVKSIDTAMTNLYKVTNETKSTYQNFLNSSYKSAKDLGRTVSDIVEQSATWAKLGYGLSESAELAKVSSIYANVGEVSNETAVSDMVTALKAFKLEASDAIKVVDPLNELGNTFATSAADLGTGLTKSASAMAAAGEDLHHTLAMITGAAEITQDAGAVGNFLKIGSMVRYVSN